MQTIIFYRQLQKRNIFVGGKEGGVLGEKLGCEFLVTGFLGSSSLRP